MALPVGYLTPCSEFVALHVVNLKFFLYDPKCWGTLLGANGEASEKVAEIGFVFRCSGFLRAYCLAYSRLDKLCIYRPNAFLD